MSPTQLPAWLSASWQRTYIKRATPDGPLGEPDSSVEVRYLQTLAGGHAFDLRIQSGFTFPEDVKSVTELTLEQLQMLAAPGAIEGFAGVTTSEPAAGDAWLFRWHAAFCFPPQLSSSDEPQLVIDQIASSQHETSDIGRAVPRMPSVRSKPVVEWHEYAPDSSYEEQWQILNGYFKQGAHLAAMRPAQSGTGACWLAILGNTFAFVRDIDRDSLPAAARDRPLDEVLADDTIPLAIKQLVLDCEFSFGFFGQGGGVGGVVERSSLPWRRGVALAALVGTMASGWQPVRASDATMLDKALAAITADHEKACEALREAEANGQEGVVEVLRARGAVV